jgi:hydroxymethylbilane synthase
MSKQRTLRLATRGSDLALRQAVAVKKRLENRRTAVELVEVETTGDELKDELIHRLGKTGAFVRALDETVLDGECDAAVHSMKDVPTDFPAELVVAGVPQRAAAGDVLLTPDGRSLADLPEGAVVGTASLRRTAELLAERPDLTVEPLRGNVDTRVEKLLAPSLQAEHERRMEAEEAASEGKDDAANAEQFDRDVDAWFDALSEIERRALGREVDTEYDAIVLAEAGLERAGLLPHVPHERLPIETFVPAPGQGAIAVTARDGDLAEDLRERLDDPRTRVETTVERTVLETLGGGCVAPLGVHATLRGEHVHVVARALSRDGTEEVRATGDLPVAEHPSAAREFAERMADDGAAELVARARVQEDEEREATR